MCIVNGCNTASRGYSKYCKYHDQHRKRHGHPLQESIHVRDLAQYRRLVKRILAKDPLHSVEAVMREYWDSMMDMAQYESDQIMIGSPHIKWDRRAYQELLKLRDSAEFIEILEIGLAIYLMAEYEPRKFSSDEGFRYQLVRRIRTTAYVNVGETYDERSGKSKRWYRWLPPKVVGLLADILIKYFSRAAARIVSIDRNDRVKQKHMRLALDGAFDKLT